MCAEERAASVVGRVVMPVVEVIEGPVGPEEGIVGALPVEPRAHGHEVGRPGPPKVVVRADHEAPTTPIDAQDRMGAVVAVGIAHVAEVRRIADEVVAAILEAEEAQIERRIGVDVPASRAVPGDAWLDPAVDGVRAVEAVAAPFGLNGRGIDVRRDGRGRAFVLSDGE